MDETTEQQRYRDDARVLGEIGEVLARAELPKITVRLPSALARAALEAWQRDGREGLPDSETFEQSVVRGHAATLGLIGLSIESSGRADGDDMLVDLSPIFVGLAVEAADHPPSPRIER